MHSSEQCKGLYLSTLSIISSVMNIWMYCSGVLTAISAGGASSLLRNGIHMGVNSFFLHRNFAVDVLALDGIISARATSSSLEPLSS